MRKIILSVMTLTVALALVACGGNTNNEGRSSQELSGAGATFPLPFYKSYLSSLPRLMVML